MSPGIAPTRSDRLVLAQAHVSGLLFLSAALLLHAAWRLAVRRVGWRGGIALLSGAALLGLLAGLSPWLWRQTVDGQRRLIAAALLVTGTGLVVLLPAIHYTAVFGAQAVLSAAILAEVGTRRKALAWFWACTVTLIVPALLYWWLVVPRAATD